MREDKLFVVEEILPNGNVMLRVLELNLHEPFSIPVKHVKKIKIDKTPTKKPKCEPVATMTITTDSYLTTTMNDDNMGCASESNKPIVTMTATMTTVPNTNLTAISQIKTQKKQNRRRRGQEKSHSI